MTKFFAIILLSYHLFGTMCLPMGDFSMMADLPKMYQHCKATEDKDLTIVDFLTDHLVDVDCFFDAHEQDEQKPHQSSSFSHVAQQINFTTPVVDYLFFTEKLTENLPQIFVSNFIPTDFLATIFRPPIF